VKTEAPSTPCFNLAPTFFGFKPEHQVQLHDQLFELVWAGEGRWDWDTIYNLPIHLRKFWVTKINKSRSKLNQNEETAQQAIKNRITRTKLPK
jgi:hypothetical protein